MWYTRRSVTRGAHVIEQNFSVAEAVAQTQLKMPWVQFPYDSAAEQRIEQLLNQSGVRDFAILNPGAGWGAKRWPPERYGCVAKALGHDGVRSIINYGPGEEDLAGTAEAASEGAATALKSSLTELITLTRRAKLFIGGDTGPMHLAAALRVPVVAIFGPTDPARNGPYGTRGIVLRSPASPTTHARRSEPDQGLLEISTDAVIDASRALLAGAATENAHG
jgi:heptosyltransferase-1